MKEIELRRSIRKYTDQQVEDEKITQLIESARLAPSGSNTQPWHFIIVKSELSKARLAAESNKQQWMLSAPIFIVCVADIRSRIKTDTIISVDENSPQRELKQIIRDTSIAIEHIVLEASHIGLSTCWVSDFIQEDIRPVLNIPDDKYVICILTVGYSAESPKARPRKKLEDIVHYENW